MAVAVGVAVVVTVAVVVDVGFIGLVLLSALIERFRSLPYVFCCCFISLLSNQIKPGENYANLNEVALHRVLLLCTAQHR